MQSYDQIEDLAKGLASEMDLYKNGHVPKKVFRKVKDFIANANMAVENGVRLATYDQLLKAGVSKQKAAITVANLTVDFTRRGKASPAINSLYMFFNAGVQGNFRIMKAFHRSNKVKALVGGITLTGFSLQLLAYMAGGDDDGKEPYIDGVPDYVKERNMVFMRPGTGGKYYTIPMPYGYNIFYNIGTEIARAMQSAWDGREYNAAKGGVRMANVALGTLNPLQSATLIQSLSPTVLDPIAMISENKSWNGSDLMPKENPYGENTADAYRYWKSASTLSKSIAQGLHRLTGPGGKYDKDKGIDISPETIELWYNTYTGSAGRFVKNMVMTPIDYLKGEDIDTRRIPFARRFMGEWSDRAISERYYDKVSEVNIYKKNRETATTKEERKQYAQDPLRRIVDVTAKTGKRLRSTRKHLKDLAIRQEKIKKNGGNTAQIDARIENVKGSILKIQTDYLKRVKT